MYVKSQKSNAWARRLGVQFALCLLTIDLASCAKSPPVLTPASNLDPLQQLKQDITAATTSPGVQRAVWGIVVHSLDRDERIFELNSRTLLVPASAAKLVSLATAVDAVGWNFRFETAVRATAAVVDGTILGDLFIVGSGDPSIGGRGGQALSTWVDGLKALGVRRIDGGIIGDDDAVEEPRHNWPGRGRPRVRDRRAVWRTEPFGNRMAVTSTRASGGRPAHVQRRTVCVVPRAPQPGPSPARQARRSCSGPSSDRASRSSRSQGRSPRGRPRAAAGLVGNPTLWFATVLRHALVTAGIDVTGEAVRRRRPGGAPEWKRLDGAVHHSRRRSRRSPSRSSRTA